MHRILDPSIPLSVATTVFWPAPTTRALAPTFTLHAYVRTRAIPRLCKTWIYNWPTARTYGHVPMRTVGDLFS